MEADPSRRVPSDRELRFFAAILLAVFGAFGGALLWQTGSLRTAAGVWGAGAGLALAYQAVRPLRQPLYRLWMAAFAPLGWLLSNLLLGAVYYLVLTPIALVGRAFRRDPLRRRFEPDVDSYWIEEDPGGEPGRYFRQS